MTLEHGYGRARDVILMNLREQRTWTTVDRICQQTGYSESHVRRILNELGGTLVKKTIRSAHLGPARYQAR